MRKKVREKKCEKKIVKKHLTENTKNVQICKCFLRMLSQFSFWIMTFPITSLTDGTHWVFFYGQTIVTNLNGCISTHLTITSCKITAKTTFFFMSITT